MHQGSAVEPGWTWLGYEDETDAEEQMFYIMNPEEEIVAICCIHPGGDWIKVHGTASDSEKSIARAIACTNCGCSLPAHDP